MSGGGSERDPVERLAEEFAQRYRRGERPSLDEYAARHPELATDIRELFPALILMEEFGPAPGPPVPRADGGGGLLRRLGPWCRRHPALTVAAATALLLVVAAGSALAVLYRQATAPEAVALRPDEKPGGADTASPHGRLYRYEPGLGFRTVRRPRGAATGGYGEPRVRAALDPDGRVLAVCARDGVALVDVLRGEEAAVLRLPGAVPLRFTPSGALLTYGAGGLLRWPVVTDPRTGRCRYGPPLVVLEGGSGDGHGSSADTRVLALPDRDNGALVIHRTEAGARSEHGGPGVVTPRKADRTHTVAPQEDVRQCAVSPDGRWVATGGHGSGGGPGVKVWKADSGRHVADLPVAECGAVLFSPDGKWLLAGDGSFRLWEVGTWRPGPSLAGPGTGGPDEAAFSPDGRWLALPGESGAIRIVRPDTGREAARLAAPGPLLLQPLCFTSGAELAALDRDGKGLHFLDLRFVRDEPGGPGPDPGARPLEIEVDLQSREERSPDPGR
jgi:WD40 repeat protein